MTLILTALVGLIAWVVLSSGQSLSLINRSNAIFTLVFTTNDQQTIALQFLQPKTTVQTTAVVVPGWAGNIRAIPYYKADASAADAKDCKAPLAEFVFSSTGTWFDASIVDYPNDPNDSGFHWIYPGGDPGWNEGCAHWPCENAYKYWNDDNYTHFNGKFRREANIPDPGSGTTVSSKDMICEFCMAGDCDHPYGWTHDDSQPSGNITTTNGVTPPVRTSPVYGATTSSSITSTISPFTYTSPGQGYTSPGGPGGIVHTSPEDCECPETSPTSIITSPGKGQAIYTSSPSLGGYSPGGNSPVGYNQANYYTTPSTTTTRSTITSTLTSTIYLPSDQMNAIVTSPSAYGDDIVTSTIIEWVTITAWVTTTVYPTYQKRHVHGQGLYHRWQS